MSLDFGLSDVHVLITGASGGIGLEITKTFQQLGARITAHYNSQIGALSSVSNIVALQADVGDEASISNLICQAAEKNGGPVSVLVVNHGIWPEQEVPIADMSLEQWQNTLSIDLTGPFLLCKHFLKSLRTAPASVQDTANIIFIGSTAGKYGEAHHGDYAACKAALMYGFTATLKNEIVAIARKGRVNSVNPGWVATPEKLETAMKDKAFVERATATTPLRKVASPSDVARQVAFVASPVLSGHVSGCNVMVDGGMEGRALFWPGQ